MVILLFIVFVLVSLKLVIRTAAKDLDKKAIWDERKTYKDNYGIIGAYNEIKENKLYFTDTMNKIIHEYLFT